MDETVFFYLVDSLLGSVVFAFGMSRVLPMRLPVAYGFVFVGTVTLLNGFGFNFLNVWVGVALVFLAQCVLPFFLYEGGALVRAVTVLAAFVCDSCATFTLYAVLALASGQTIPEDESLYVQFVTSHLFEYAIASLVSWLVLLGLLQCVSVVARRFAGIEGGRSSWVFVAFALSHVLLMVPLALLAVAVDMDALFYGVSLALCAVCLTVDMLMCSFMDRAISAASDKERARTLGASLDACFAQCDAFVAEVEQTAKMRHDVRNQAHAAIALAESGEFSRARDHVSSFSELYASKRPKT